MSKKGFVFDIQRFNSTKTKEALLEFLKNAPDGQQYIATVEAMESAYQEEISRKTTDNKTVRQQLLEAKKEAKTTKENYSKVMLHLGIDEDTDDLDGELEKVSKSKGANSEWQRKYDALKKKSEKEAAEKDAAATAEREKRHELLRSNAIVTAINDKVHNPAEISKLLTSKIKIGDDDSLFFVAEDGKELSIDDGVKGWLSTNTWAAKNPQNNGANSGGGFGGNGSDSSATVAKNLAETNAAAQAAAVKAQDIYFK